MGVLLLAVAGFVCLFSEHRAAQTDSMISVWVHDDNMAATMKAH